jgi:hypothetical protein
MIASRCSALDRTAHAGEQLADIERFREVVVGTGEQSGDAILRRAVLAAEDDHGRAGAEPVDELAAELECTAVEIEQDQARELDRDAVERRPRVGDTARAMPEPAGDVHE